MLKKTLATLLTLLSANVAFGIPNCGTGLFSPGLFCPETYWDVGIGYRKDDLRWKIDLPHDDRLFQNLEIDPTLRKDKLKLEDQKIYLVSLQGHIPVGLAYLRFYADYGEIRSGKAHESLGSFAECRTISNSFKGSHVYDFCIAMGYPYYYLPDYFIISPTYGFSFHKQRIRTKNTDRFFTLPIEFDETLCDPRERNKYRFKWWGPWLGVDLSYSFPYGATAYNEVEYHLSRSGRCEWTRDTRVGILSLRKRHHRENAHALINKFGINWVYCACLYLDLNWQYQHWSSGGGKEKVTWCSNTVFLSLGRLF